MTDTTSGPGAPMAALAAEWLKLWNGEYSAAEKFIRPDFRVHAAMLDGSDGSNAAGHYGGGFPGATAPVGTPIGFTGTDLLRAQDGLLAEYWVNSDIHVLLTQLQITPPGRRLRQRLDSDNQVG